MSQVDAFNDNVTDTTATQPFTALAKPPSRELTAAAEHETGRDPDSSWP